MLLNDHTNRLGWSLMVLFVDFSLALCVFLDDCDRFFESAPRTHPFVESFHRRHLPHRNIPYPMYARCVCGRDFRAQTSSLNVTAGDYSVLSNRSGIDLLNLEPSEAPNRRGLPGAVGEQIVSGDNVQPLSSFMLSGPMVPSSPSLLVSSAPVSRAGALTRAPPGGRNSLSINAQIERSNATLQQQQQQRQQQQQQLDMSSHVPDREFSEAVPPGVVPIPPADLLLPGSPVNGVTVEVKPDLPSSDDVSGVAEELLDDLKLDTDRNELMTRQKIQPSFKADAPVSLEQVGWHVPLIFNGMIRVNGEIHT